MIVQGTIPHRLGELSRLKWLTMHENALTGSIPQYLQLIPELHRFTCWNNKLDRRYNPEQYNLGTIHATGVYETQQKQRDLPDLKFF